jgi:hypothetical protein
MSALTNSILAESTASRIAGAAAQIAGATLEEIESSLPRALAGDRSQVRAYVLAYRQLTSRMLNAVGEARPDLLLVDRQSNRVLVAVEAKARGRHPTTVSWVRTVLEGEAMSTPFTDWVGTLGVGRGTAVRVVALLRDTLPGAEPLPPPRSRRLPEWDLDEQGVGRFYRAVWDELERSEAPLERIRVVLGLNRTELAALFGVRRQALDRWSAHGVPAERQEKLATLGEIADLLEAKLKGDRVAGVVRRSTSAYGGRSILAAIADDDQESVLAELRDAFDWSAAA